MYGIHNLPQEEVQKYAVEMLKQEEQVRQISQEVAMGKLKDVILEKAKKKLKLHTKNFSRITKIIF
jgi:trigger factor